jgi:large subunit ribosomal protein L16
MLAPKRIVHKKLHKPSTRHGTLKRGSTLVYGTFGLQATSSSWLTSRQIEAARQVLSRRTKGGKVIARVFPSQPVTAKGQKVPMGSGVGAIDYFMFPVQPGRIIFEIVGIESEAQIKEAFRIAACKLPFTYRMVVKKNVPTIKKTIIN